MTIIEYEYAAATVRALAPCDQAIRADRYWQSVGAGLMASTNMARAASEHRDESLRHFTGKAATWMKTKANSGRALASASLRRCAALLGKWDARMRERAFLATLNDVQLRDMGLSSTDRWREVNKPFWQP